jgi:hypothetical protein
VAPEAWLVHVRNAAGRDRFEMGQVRGQIHEQDDLQPHTRFDICSPRRCRLQFPRSLKEPEAARSKGKTLDLFV